MKEKCPKTLRKLFICQLFLLQKASERRSEGRPKEHQLIAVQVNRRDFVALILVRRVHMLPT